jgi:hypothetical protein
MSLTLPGMGRPSKIDQVVGYRTINHDDGTTEQRPVTTADRITAHLRNGNYFEQACAAAGVHRETAYGWLRIGAQAIARAASTGIPLDDLDLPVHHLACVAFSDAVAEAEAEWEVRANTTLETLARGGITSETVTEKQDPTRLDENGQPLVVERTVRTERTLPSAQVLEWRLTRRFPERYGHRVDLVARAGDGSLPMNDRAAALAAELRSYLQGREDAAAEADAATEP